MNTVRVAANHLSGLVKGSITDHTSKEADKNVAKDPEASPDTPESAENDAALYWKDENVDLLIVGAGPAGLTAACWAAQYSMSTRIIDRKGGRTPTGHADGLQSRTLEILESFGIVEPILKQGVHDVDTCHWATNNETGAIERVKRYETHPEKRSRFGQILLNQGAIEQVLNDSLHRKGTVTVEWHKEAESLQFSTATDDDAQHFPVTVGVKGTEGDGKEIIHARYLVACDGAHSWARDRLGVSTDTVSEASTWGVLDIIPITNFPDIRRSCSIDSQPHGSIMTVPRENGLVRFYIHLRGVEEANMQHPSCSPQAMVEMAKKIMKPYNLAYEHCDWWSTYSIGRRLVRQYRPHERVFLAGDAAHTHSPKGGQGAVITTGADPMILETYDTERRPVAKQLMDLDSRLVQAYEKNNEDLSSGIYEVREQYAGFMAGVDVTYPASILVAGKEAGASTLASNIRLGMRLPSFPVISLTLEVSEHLAGSLVSDGSWRLLVFPGDLRRLETIRTLNRFSGRLRNYSHLADLQQMTSGACRRPIIELLLLLSTPASEIDWLDLPDLFRPSAESLGWDNWRVITDDQDQAYTGYGVDKGGPGCLVLCRPDLHVAWIGSMEDVAGLDSYFSMFTGTFRIR